MPLPLLIPLVVGAGAAAAGGGLTAHGTKRIKAAKDRYLQAHAAYVRRYQDCGAFCCLVEQDLRKLGQAKVGALETLKDAVECIKKARLGDRDLRTKANITAPELEKIEALHDELIKTIGGYGASLGGGLTAGALGALGAYGLVGTLGAASTGTAIGTLGGAAATNAALAWFGGGSLAAGGAGIAGGTAVLGGIVAAPAVIAIGAFTEIKAGKVEKETERQIKQINVEEANLDRNRALLTGVQHRTRELLSATYRLDNELKAALRSASERDFHIEEIYKVAQIAKTLSVVIDEPVAPKEATK